MLQYFFRLLDASHLFSGTPLYSHVAAIRILILTNCYGTMNLLLRKFTFTENQPFLRNFYATKIWSRMVLIDHLQTKVWFLRIASVCMCMCVCVFVCPSPRLLITNGVIWIPYDWLNRFYSFYMATAVIIGSSRGLRIEAHSVN